MDLATQRLMQAAAGAGGEGEYIDDLFSTSLRTGNGGNKTIENSLDLSTEGGIVWVKERNSGNSHTLFATDMPDVSGKRPYLATNQDNLQRTKSNIDIAFYSNGYQIQGDDGQINQASGNTYVDWSMRKAPGFFDVVTYTGNGSARTIAHSLGSVPGSIWVKCLSESQSWSVYHRESNSSPEDYELRLDDTNAAFNYNSPWNSTLPTSTHFSVGTHGSVNGNGKSYIALIFAHDEQSFGKDANSSVIKCGGYSISSQNQSDINLGWEPSFLLVKKASGTSNWWLLDAMRGMGPDHFNWLYANTSDDEEAKTYEGIYPTSTGFNHEPANNGQWSDGDYIYIAVRRTDGYVGKPPELGTDVFALDGSGAGTPGPSFVSNFPVDFGLTRKTGASQDWYTGARVLGSKYLKTNANGDANTDAEMAWDFNNGFVSGNFFGNSANQGWMWKRHAGFDVVAYTGTGSNRTIAHSMGVAPTMMWVKRRNSARYWGVYHSGLGDNRFLLRLNENSDYTNDQAAWNNTAPTSTVFSVGTSTTTNASGSDYIAILFASITGISAVGSYSGSGSTGNAQNIGFQPRFLFIKRTNSTGDWMQFNSVGGFGNYMQLNTTQQQNSQTYVNVSSTGFSLVSDYGDTNESGSSYIYYAHA